MKKVILITRASSGMGKEAAIKLIQDGHIVYAVARRIDHMQDLKAMGFEHPQYFCRLFKSKTGMTPLEFRTIN